MYSIYMYSTHKYIHTCTSDIVQIEKLIGMERNIRRLHKVVPVNIIVETTMKEEKDEGERVVSRSTAQNSLFGCQIQVTLLVNTLSCMYNSHVYIIWI